MQTFEIIAAGPPNTAFDRWVVTLQRAGIQAKQISIADCNAESGCNPKPHPRETFISSFQLKNLKTL
jgi:hypothetical protein